MAEVGGAWGAGEADRVAAGGEAGEEEVGGRFVSVFRAIPTFAHIGGCGGAKEEIRSLVEMPIKYEFLFGKIKLPRGALLYGMPGCGKTYFAQAVANELKINFLSVKGPELLNKYIG